MSNIPRYDIKIRRWFVITDIYLNFIYKNQFCYLIKKSITNKPYVISPIHNRSSPPPTKNFHNTSHISQEFVAYQKKLLNQYFQKNLHVYICRVPHYKFYSSSPSWVNSCSMQKFYLPFSVAFPVATSLNLPCHIPHSLDNVGLVSV